MMWIACLLLVPICAAATAGGANPEASPEASPNTRLLDNIRSYVQEDVSACDNYFEHACGKYAARHIDDPFTEITQMLDYKVNQKLVQLMADLRQRSQAPGFDASSVDAKVLHYYLTCRHAPQSTRLAKEYLRRAPPDEGLTWPQFSPRGTPWPADQFKWLKTLGQLHRYGLSNVLVSVLVTRSFQNSSEFVLDLSMPSFAGEAQHLPKPLETRATLRAMAVPENSERPLGRKIRRLESAVLVLTEADDDDDGQLLRVDQLGRETGQDWQGFVELVVGHSVSSDFQVQVHNIPYFRALVRLMNSTDAHTVAHYIMTRFVLHLLEDTMDSSEPIECVKDVRRSMGLAADLLYKERFLDPAGTLPQHVQQVMEVFEQLRRQFLLQIAENRLGLTREQNRMIAVKARNIAVNIGNMPRRRDLRTFASRHYADLVFPAADFDFSREHLRLLEFRARRQMEQLGRPLPSADEFFYLADADTAMSSSPFYLMHQNLIVVPHGSLQEPFFAPDSHGVFKFSLLGFVLAHELIHSVDTTGLLFDSHGNLHDIGPAIMNSPRFEAGLQCMKRSQTQYLDEHIADMAGLDLAYSAYFQNARDGNCSDFTDIPPQQIFFLNLAQFFCGDGDQSNFVDHDNDQMRLQQMLNGFAPFHRAFGCQSRAQSEKCQLW
ncbi:membrane metallo-endopeptidase-like 1 [Drosophila biarmipes]|uniref:membrane metallo-endopeptidase-like 1 n=1 Tax=Drosophila biarmipes TaxID=125945 RepID=UPI0021CD08DF|nr:membrane metallo-endopeptidase-like 1 [Drosophila biarmipes]